MMACVFSSHISPLLKSRQVSLNLAAGGESMAAGINTSSSSCSPWKSSFFPGEIGCLRDLPALQIRALWKGFLTTYLTTPKQVFTLLQWANAREVKAIQSLFSVFIYLVPDQQRCPKTLKYHLCELNNFFWMLSKDCFNLLKYKLFVLTEVGTKEELVKQQSSLIPAAGTPSTARITKGWINWTSEDQHVSACCHKHCIYLCPLNGCGLLEGKPLLPFCSGWIPHSLGGNNSLSSWAAETGRHYRQQSQHLSHQRAKQEMCSEKCAHLWP